MPDKLHRCVKAVIESGKSEESAWAICNAQFKDTLVGHFNDSVVYNPTEKTAVSVRDGVIEYLGGEIGLEPAHEVFTVYRSPATIANAAARMAGIPLTDEHVELDTPAPRGDGVVRDAEMIDVSDPATRATIAIRNRIELGDTLLMAVESGKRELSLGYNAELVPHDEYDFEQREIIPHHLAAVPKGRCGPMCSFIDKKGVPDMKTKFHKAFADADGALNMQQIVELVQALPEAIKAVPMDQLQELMPALQTLVAAAKEVMPAPEPTEPAPVEPTEPAMDADPEVPGEPKKEPPFTDSKAFKDAVGFAIKRHTEVIEKARPFLPENYAFADKSTETIMRDALATETTENFADSELPLAFKMLKRTESRYQEFADKTAGDALDALATKEL